MRQVRTMVLIAGIAAAAALGCCPAGAEEAMSPAGREAVRVAMMNEALTFAKYKLFAEHARKAGKTELADLMAVTSNQEYGHFLRWAAMYGLVGTDVQNLRQAAQDELNDDMQLYTRLASEADARGEKTLGDHFRTIELQEQGHHEKFEQAVEKALNSK